MAVSSKSQAGDPRQKNGPAISVAIDPTSDAPAWTAAGLPLLVRLGKQLEASGASAIRLVSSENEKRWLDLLARGECHLAVEVERPLATGETHPVTDSGIEAPRLGEAARGLRTQGDTADGGSAWSAPAQGSLGGSSLDGAAIYDGGTLEGWVAGGASDPAPKPLVSVRRLADLAAADRAVWRSIRKSLSHDGPVAYYLARPLSSPLTRLSARLGLRPNLVSGVGLVVGLAAGAVAALGGYLATLGAATLFFAGLILDCVDGDLARGTLSTSRLGQWMDTVTDDLSYVALAVGLGVGITRDGGDAIWLWLGLSTLVLVVMGQAVIYHWLWRSGGPVDTARYPWFFMGKEGLAHRGKRSLVGWLSFAVRRDSLTLMFLGLALLDLPWGILVLLFGGSVVYALLLMVDLLLARRGRRPKEPT